MSNYFNLNQNTYLPETPSLNTSIPVLLKRFDYFFKTFFQFNGIIKSFDYYLDSLAYLYEFMHAHIENEKLEEILNTDTYKLIDVILGLHDSGSMEDRFQEYDVLCITNTSDYSEFLKLLSQYSWSAFTKKFISFVENNEFFVFDSNFRLVDYRGHKLFNKDTFKPVDAFCKILDTKYENKKEHILLFKDFVNRLDIDKYEGKKEFPKRIVNLIDSYLDISYVAQFANIGAITEHLTRFLKCYVKNYKFELTSKI